jgi:hypothetical protein
MFLFCSACESFYCDAKIGIPIIPFGTVILFEDRVYERSSTGSCDQ